MVMGVDVEAQEADDDEKLGHDGERDDEDESEKQGRGMERSHRRHHFQRSLIVLYRLFRQVRLLRYRCRCRCCRYRSGSLLFFLLPPPLLLRRRRRCYFRFRCLRQKYE